MIIRKSVLDESVTLHKNTKPGMVKRYINSSGESSFLTYPTDKKDYFVVSDGEIVKLSDSFATAEKEFAKLTGEEVIDFVKHKLVNNKLQSR